MMQVTKKSGEKEAFSEEKLRTSLQRSGATKDAIQTVVNKIEHELYEGISTTELYAKAFDILKSLDTACAGRYSLKEGLRELGPTGFPFERLASKIFEHKGFHVTRGQILEGTCITHEVDIIAYNDEICHIIECKFHNDLGHRLSVHVPMYVKSRFDDVHAANKTWNGVHFSDYSQCWIIHNAKLSNQSIEFATCHGINLLGWRYPQDKGLEYYIHKFSLYPITTLTQISRIDAHKLIKQNIVLCKEIQDNQNAIRKLGYSQDEVNRFINECDKICQE